MNDMKGNHFVLVNVHHDDQHEDEDDDDDEDEDEDHRSPRS